MNLLKVKATIFRNYYYFCTIIIRYANLGFFFRSFAIMFVYFVFLANVLRKTPRRIGNNYDKIKCKYKQSCYSSQCTGR